MNREELRIIKEQWTEYSGGFTAADHGFKGCSVEYSEKDYNLIITYTKNESGTVIPDKLIFTIHYDYERNTYDIKTEIYKADICIMLDESDGLFEDNLCAKDLLTAMAFDYKIDISGWLL